MTTQVAFALTFRSARTTEAALIVVGIITITRVFTSIQTLLVCAFGFFAAFFLACSQCFGFGTFLCYVFIGNFGFTVIGRLSFMSWALMLRLWLSWFFVSDW